MKSLFSILLCAFFVETLCAQSIGINTTEPVSPLHVSGPAGHVLTIENSNSLDASVESNLIFAHGLEAGNYYKYTGAIKSIGSNVSQARLGFYTGASATPFGLTERLTIGNNGYVGIGTNTPDYKLDVNGPAYFGNYIGIQTPPTAGYSLDVVGTVRVQNDIRVNGILNPNNPLAIGNNTSIEGTLTVLNGKGIVRSVNANQMKIKRVSVAFSAANFPPGNTVTSGNLGFAEDFTSVSVIVGQPFNGTGEWAKIFIVPFNVDNAANTCQFKLTNVSNSAIDFSGNWEIILIGY